MMRIDILIVLHFERCKLELSLTNRCKSLIINNITLRTSDRKKSTLSCLYHSRLQHQFELCTVVVSLNQNQIEIIFIL